MPEPAAFPEPLRADGTDAPGSPLSALHHHWRVILDDVATRLAAQPADAYTGLVVIRIPPQPALYRLTCEAAYALQAEILRRLREALRPVDRIHALDSWEWLALLPGLPSSAPVTLAMLKLQRLLGSPPLRLAEIEIVPTLGGAIAPEMGSDAHHLIQSARIASMAAEAGAPQLFDPEMERSEAETRTLATECSAALANGRFELHLQPQIEIATRACIQAEALLRWRRTNGENVPPPQTVAIIERLGLRPQFNRWLFRQAVQMIASLDAAGIGIEISINLTGNDLLDPELPDLAEQTLGLWHVAPARLMLEITENVAVQETQDVAVVLDRLRRIGFRLSIDDFGTGYAGMSYLQRLPVHEVKIDQSFVRRVNDSERDYEIVASVIALAHRLGVSVVAEGVEDEAVLASLAALGCERAQGFLFSHALPLEDFKAWWQAHRPLALPPR